MSWGFLCKWDHSEQDWTLRTTCSRWKLIVIPPLTWRTRDAQTPSLALHVWFLSAQKLKGKDCSSLFFLASTWPLNRSLINPTELMWPLFGGHNIWRFCPRISDELSTHGCLKSTHSQPLYFQDSRDGSYTSDLASLKGEENVTFNWQLLQWQEFSEKFYILYILSCLTLRHSFEMLSPQFYRGNIWDSKSLSDLFELIHPISGGAEIWLLGQHDSIIHGLLTL